MPLSIADIAALSRLLDAGLALPRGEHAAWLLRLPADQQPLVPRLRRMLADGHGDFLSSFPRLGEGAAPEPIEASTGELVGPYRLLEEIGRGGMGSVWRAARADGIFEREVALKLPRLHKGGGLAERMARERQIGALLEHPNIARLYDAGIDDRGRPYLVMERIAGADIVTHARNHELDTADRIRLVQQACAALAHAHRLLVVHRDIKPSNLLVDERGELKLLDFGIARLLDGDGSPGEPGSSALSEDSRQTHTPRYAAPEQQHGAGPISTAMDIYSLGVVLHELVAGDLPATPHVAGPPRSAAPSSDLDRVLRRALDVQPSQRYASVEGLADDLRRVLERRPVRAGRTPASHRARLFVARHRNALVLALGALCLVAGAGALLVRQQAREAVQAQRALQARDFLLDLLEDAEPAAGQAAGQVTSLQMLNSALERARRGFAGQPLVKANVLVELGHMFQVLDQPDQALAVLREAHALLAAQASSDEPLLHLTQAYLAIAWLDRDEPEAPTQATSWANQALADCSADTPVCAKAHGYAHDVLRNLANARGDLRTATVQARLSVQDYRRGFGADHAETALAWRSLAVILRNGGAPQEAADALAEASRIAAASPLRAADALDLRMKQVLVQADLGDYTHARAGLEVLIAASAPAASRLEQQRLRAQVLLAQGLLQAADAAAQEVVDTADPAKNPWEAALALQARAQAQAALGRTSDARRELAGAAERFERLGLPEDSVPRQRVQWVAAELALRDGQLDAAQAIADRLSPLAGLNRAQALMVRGVVARLHGDAVAAVALHREAATLLAAGLPPTHPLRLRNALDLAIAQWLAQGARDRSALAAARADYVKAWPTGSAWKDVPDADTASPAAWQREVL